MQEDTWKSNKRDPVCGRDLEECYPRSIKLAMQVLQSIARSRIYNKLLGDRQATRKYTQINIYTIQNKKMFFNCNQIVFNCNQIVFNCNQIGLTC